MSVNVESVSVAPQNYTGDVLVVTHHAADTLRGSLAELAGTSNGYIDALFDSGELSTEVGKVSVHFRVPGLAAPCLAVVGAGPQEKWDADVAFRCAGSAAKTLANRQRARVGFCFGKLDNKSLSAAVAGAMNGCTGQDLFRSEKKLHPPGKIEWLEPVFKNSPSPFEEGIQRGIAIGQSMLLARELINLPANYLFPQSFVGRAAEVSISHGIELEIWDELRLRREDCNALLAVSSGSTRPPRLLIMRYAGLKQQAPLALVGKGVTFDSGGLSIKPSEGMLNMKCDMAGAATVVAAMQAIASLRLAAPVVGLIGLTENMISGSSYKLGDVLTSRSGKTIEIQNTDAEGRLVLADVLNVALDESPSRIIDLATLTGACLVALGTDVAGSMSNDETWQNQISLAAKRAGEQLWPLPMFPHFAEQIQSKVADIKNVGDGRWGGAITAAKFLQEFVGDTPWTHLDIAGPAFHDRPKAHMDAGASGAMVRTLVELVESL